MSDARLKRYLARPLRTGQGFRKLILLSDSKGNYLKRYILPGDGVSFECKSGRRLADGLLWLYTNIDQVLQTCSHVCLYVWLGTCDLTARCGKLLKLRHVTIEDCYRYFAEQIERYYVFLANHSKVKIVFLQIPPYSIVSWYMAKGTAVTDADRIEDLKLFERICLINEFVDTCNDNRGVFSPRFKLDLINDKKRAGKSGRRSVTYKFYLDGIHPGPLLARVWLKRIIEKSVIDCQ